MFTGISGSLMVRIVSITFSLTSSLSFSSSMIRLLGGIGGRVELHLLDHADQAVGARGRQMLAQPDLLQECQRSSGHRLRRLVRKDAHHQGNQPLGNACVGIGLENHLTILKARLQPHLRLATLHFPGVGAKLGIERLQPFPQPDDVLVLVEPFVEHGELFDDLRLALLNGGRSGHPSTFCRRRIPSAKRSISSSVLNTAKEARMVPVTPYRAMAGWAQWWPVRTAMPIWSRNIPAS